MTEKNVERLFVAIFGAMLAIFAAFITWGGVKVVYEQRWLVTIKASRSLLLASENGRWSELLEGRDAQVAGVGLISFGLLFAVWFIGLLFCRTKPLAERPGPLSMLSALFFTTTVTLLLPPWSVAKSAFVAKFWLFATVWTVAILAIIRRHDRMRFVAALFVATLLAEFVAPMRSTGGAGLGLIVTIGALWHAMLVYRPWRKWVIEQNRMSIDHEQ
jgi:hypothetical protein